MVLFLCKILLEVKMKGEMFNMNVEELNTQLEYLDETKGLIKQAIIDKGQSISENDTFRSFVQKINDIETRIETANIPIWYVKDSRVDMTELISRIIDEKISLSYYSLKDSYVRADGYDVSRLKPEIGDFVIYLGNFTSPYDSSENKGYIFLGQILTQQEELDTSSYTGNLQIISACGLDEFNTSIGILSDNIKAGIQILGVNGNSANVNTSDANAMANDIALNKTAYVNGQKIIGTMANQGKISIFPNSNAVEKSSAYHTWVKVPADTETELYRTCYKLSDMIVNGQPNSIPNTYELLEYLEGTGTQYIKLPFPTLNTNISNGNYNVYLDAQFTDLSPRDSGSVYHLEGIGSMSSSAMDFYKAELYIGWKQETAGTQYFYYNNCDNDDWDSTTPADTQRHLFEINSKSSAGSGDKGLYIDGIKVHSDGPTVSTCKYKYNYCLFGYENADGVWCNKIKIYSCTIKKVQDGSTLYELVPVKRKSDNVLGMYDVTNNRFYTNNGSGTFQYGEF